MLTIERLLASDDPNAAAQTFVREHTSPIVEGTSVTFLFEGAADQVSHQRPGQILGLLVQTLGQAFHLLEFFLQSSMLARFFPAGLVDR